MPDPSSRLAVNNKKLVPLNNDSPCEVLSPILTIALFPNLPSLLPCGGAILLDERQLLAASGHTESLLLRVSLEAVAIRIQISVFANNR